MKYKILKDKYYWNKFEHIWLLKMLRLFFFLPIGLRNTRRLIFTKVMNDYYIRTP